MAAKIKQWTNIMTTNTPTDDIYKELKDLSPTAMEINPTHYLRHVKDTESRLDAHSMNFHVLNEQIKGIQESLSFYRICLGIMAVGLLFNTITGMLL